MPMSDLDIPQHESSVLRLSVRTAMVLLVYIVTFTALIAATYLTTLGPVTESAKKEKLALIGEVLPPESYDNVLLNDWIEVAPTRELGTTDFTRLYRARKGNQPVALVIEAAAPDGYSGRIGLLLAVKVNGELAAVRVTEHRETPGLGDYIVPKKDRNKAHPWINQFDEKSMEAVTLDKWKVKKDGGVFDQRAGATISARAVTNASGRALAWTNIHRTRLFETTNGKRYE